MPASPQCAERGDLAPTTRVAVVEAVPAPSPPTPIAPPRAAAEPRRRLIGADLLRAAAVLGVLLIHAGYWPGRSTQPEWMLWNAVVGLARFCVPAFVVLAGVVLEYNRRGPLDAPAFARRRALRSVVPWLVWAPVFLVYGVVVSGDVHRSGTAALTWLEYGGGHLYFLLLIPQLYLAYLLWPRGLRRQVTLASAAVAVQTALCALRVAVGVPDGLLRQLLVQHAYQEAPFWIGYFAAGVVVGHLARRKGPVLEGRAVVVAGAALVAAGSSLVLLADPIAGPGRRGLETGTGDFLRPELPVLVAGVVLLALAAGGRGAAGRGTAALTAAGGRLRGAVDRLSRDALGIYVVQPALLYPLGRLLFGWLESPILPLAAGAFVLLVAGALAGSMLVTEALARTRLRVLVGRA